MKKLISLTNISFESLISEFFILVLISLVIIWIITLWTANTANMQKERISYKHRMKIAGQNGLIAAMLCFVLYFIIFFAINGKEAFVWSNFPIDNSNTYLHILPQVLLFLGIITAFIIVTQKLKKELKRK